MDSDSSDAHDSGGEGARSQRSDTPPRKVRKRHYDQKYIKSWEKEKEYAGWLQGSANQQTITQFGQGQSKKAFEDKIKTGEIRMACFLAKNNLPFNIAGDLKILIQDVCTDSEIAKQITFEKTKAQAIITNVTGKLSHSELVETLKTERFSLIVDENTDKSTTKHLALIARTTVDFKVEDNFLCLIPIVDGSASALHEKCKQYFDNQNIPYKQNMIGFAADGANTMFGPHHSLSTLFATEIPNLFLMKCICHSFHLCASYACKTLPRGVEDFARDVYNYIQNSPKRMGDYEEFQCFVAVKPHKLLHQAQTRWLSLLPVVKRLLEQLPALQLYFQNAVLNDRLLAAQTIHIKSMDPSTELYLNFLDFVLPYFHDINKEMQSESPKLYLLYERIFTIYKTIMECFIKPDILQLTEGEKTSSRDKSLDSENKILSLDYENKMNHLTIEEVYLGAVEMDSDKTSF
ncbi:uncharacterized protein [Leptinotarsa decemlineata]|uniref:uncharacterized protein n=1 Tax=Leptinotarsa decemlineata TaxID=7539 RepID=UPI003D304AD1